MIPLEPRTNESWLLSNDKSLGIPGDVLVEDGDAFDVCASRADVQRGFDASHRVLLAFDECLDASIEQICNPTGHAFARGRIVDEPAEADALHTSADHESPRHFHRCVCPAAASVQAKILSDAIARDGYVIFPFFPSAIARSFARERGVQTAEFFRHIAGLASIISRK